MEDELNAKEELIKESPKLHKEYDLLNEVYSKYKINTPGTCQKGQNRIL